MASLGVFGLMVAFIELQGSSTCPTPDQIADRLHDLISDTGMTTTPRERVALSNDAGALTLELRDESGRPLARRRFAAAACDDLAQAAAIVIAAWATELRSANTPDVVLPRQRPRRLDFEIDGAFVGSLAGSAFAAGGEFGAALGPRRSRVLGHALVTATATRDLHIGSAANAHVSFTRASLALGPVVRFRPGRFLLDLDAQASVALVYLAGIGFADATRAYDVDVGLGGGGRAAIRARAVAPYLGLRVVGWLRPLSAVANGPSGGSTPLPRFELLFTAGLAFGND